MSIELNKILIDKKTYHHIGGIEENSLIKILDHLKLYKEKSTLVINSHGGDADIAHGIYSAVKSFKIRTIGMSIVESAAFTIFLAGKKRLAVNGTTFLAHNCRTNNLWTNLFYTEQLKNRNEWGKELLLENNVDLGSYFLRKQVFLTTNQAYEKGIVTDIIHV